MRRIHLTACAALALLVPVAAACGSDDKAPKSTPTVAPAASTYTNEARAVLNDLASAQRALATALTASDPLSDAWRQGVAARVTALAALDDRAQKLSAPADRQDAQRQLLLATRRSREAAETIAAAVADGNVSMLERANAILADASFQGASASAALGR